MPELPADPRLCDFQRYVTELEHERGFADQGPRDKCLLLGEEVGELFKAVRAREGLPVDELGQPVAEELADIFIYLCSIANRYGIDLEQAFRDKERKNQGRSWRPER